MSAVQALKNDVGGDILGTRALGLLLTAALVTSACLAAVGFVPVRWLGSSSEVLYWTSWLKPVPSLWRAVSALADRALEELLSSGRETLNHIESLCPCPTEEVKCNIAAEALDLCQAGISRLDGTWQDGLLNSEAARLFERLHLHAAHFRLCGHPSAASRQRAREHFSYANVVASELRPTLAGAAAPGRQCLTEVGAAAAGISRIVMDAVSPGAAAAADGEVDGVEIRPGGDEEQVQLLRGVVAAKILAVGEVSPALRQAAEADVLRLMDLGARHVGARAYLMSRDSSRAARIGCCSVGASNCCQLASEKI
eukprot:TRINITY_DN29121_c0_g1_i1.p1 TRINITY_DN29121_c0_g1~~TRINITY_DN29121_c0_g1_i1.p1  ORF type:complete len:325 (+),score=53.89 TRINITY_DN29121_c0_g1_i1:45-977(+)